MFGGTPRRRFSSLACLGAIIFVGACGDDPEPLEPTTSSPTAAPSPSLEGDGPPPMPDLATEDSEAGAIAFVEHYIDVFNYAANSGDVEPLRALSHPDCEGCESYASSFEEQYEAGGYNEGLEWEINSSATLDDFVEIVVTSGPYEYLENEQVELRTITSAQHEVGFELGDDPTSRIVLDMYAVVD